MRGFACPSCGSPLYFENSICVTCGTAVGYSRTERTMVAVGGSAVCANLNLNGCNWVLDRGEPPPLCFSCRLTRTRPADADLAGLADYHVAESAKRRLVAGLDALELPVMVSDGYLGLAFDLLSSARAPVTTGYHNGVITFDLAETQDAHREQLRVSMAEPYRTVLGHFRHEIGHYYCELLALTTDRRDEFRRLFGDETVSYAQALSSHYAQGFAAEWADDFISAYATMHPLEDFAEVFAHFLHITDTLETAVATGLLPDPESSRPAASVPFDQVIVETWLPLSIALNQINKSMGRDELYPFVLSEVVIGKLSFVASLMPS
jgi:hypothetical protein